MSMISPLKTDSVGSHSVSGRPVGGRTLEIMGELQMMEALGKATCAMKLTEREEEKFDRFSARARAAARKLGRSVRVRQLSDGRAEITLLQKVE